MRTAGRSSVKTLFFIFAVVVGMATLEPKAPVGQALRSDLCRPASSLTLPPLQAAGSQGMAAGRERRRQRDYGRLWAEEDAFEAELLLAVLREARDLLTRALVLMLMFALAPMEAPGRDPRTGK